MQQTAAAAASSPRGSPPARTLPPPPQAQPSGSASPASPNVSPLQAPQTAAAPPVLKLRSGNTATLSSFDQRNSVTAFGGGPVPTIGSLKVPFGVDESVLTWVVETGWLEALASNKRPDLRTRTGPISSKATASEIIEDARAIMLKLVDAQGARAGLQFALHHLRYIVPPPDDKWHAAVFANYDEDEDGLINYESFADIITQYHDHHAKRNYRHYIQRCKRANQTVPSTLEQYDTTGVTNNTTPEDKRSASTRAGESDEDGEPSERVTLASHILFPVHRGPCEVFRDYEFGNNAGQGSFGKVQVVTHKSTGQKRACKTMAVACAEQWDLIKLEIDLMKQLDHPNILRLHEIYHDGYTVYLIIELCEGGQLFDRIVDHYEKKRQAITEAQVGIWMTQILSSTAYCHSKGIIHRDIKPENILFVENTDNSPLKVIDFGLSSTIQKIRDTQREIVERKSGVSGLVARMMPRIGGKQLIPYHVKRIRMQRAGTPHYMAPEMIRGCYDERCDVFSVGVIMYQLLTGIHPFYTAGVDDENSVRERILTEIPGFVGVEWQFVSNNAKELVKAMLRKNPLKRITAKEALQHPWFEQLKKSHSPLAQSFVSVSVLEGLRSWQNQNKLKQAVVQLLAKELSEGEIKDLRAKFTALDKGKDGSITLNDVRLAMEQSGHHVLDTDLQQVFAASGSSGQISRFGYNEFISALLCKRMSFQEYQLREIFNKLDSKKEGRINVASLGVALKNTKRYGSLSTEDVKSIFSEIDKNNDGYLDFYEFLELMTQ